MAYYRVGQGGNPGSSGDDTFELLDPVASFQVDGVGGYDELIANIAFLQTWHANSIEKLTFHGQASHEVSVTTDARVIDATDVHSTFRVYCTDFDQIVFGNPDITNVAITDGRNFDFHFDSGLAQIYGDGPGTETSYFYNIHIITGWTGNDRLWGDDRDNVFEPVLGSDRVYGAGGFDEIWIHEDKLKWNEATVHRSADTVHIKSELNSGDQIEATGIERVRFLDVVGNDIAVVAFDTGVNENTGTTYRTYQAAYDRFPDKAGLGFWVSQVDKGLSLHEMAEYFLSSNEFNQIYGDSPTNRELVAAFYENVLQREPDQAGIDFWTGQLSQGKIDRADLLLYFADSNENVELVEPDIEDGVWLL